MSVRTWTPSETFLANSCHVWSGAFAVNAALCKGWEWWAIAIMVAIAALKEFWADLTWLENDTLSGSTIDFCGYCAGGVIGYLTFLPWGVVQ